MEHLTDLYEPHTQKVEVGHSLELLEQVQRQEVPYRILKTQINDIVRYCRKTMWYFYRISISKNIVYTENANKSNL